MGNVPATEFKAKCLELMDRVAERRETFVITKRGKPVARLVPVERRPKQSIFGWMRGTATIRGDIVSPTMPDAEAEVLKEWDELNAPGEPPGRRHRRKPPKARRRPA
jgi:prevent-host-death family protein